MSITAMWGLTHRDAIKRVFDRYGYSNETTSENNPNRRRKQNIAQRLRLYRNDADYDLAGVIDALFVDENVRQQRKKLIPLAMYENVAKRIVDEVASLYNRPAVRTLTENNDAYRAICSGDTPVAFMACSAATISPPTGRRSSRRESATSPRRGCSTRCCRVSGRAARW